MRERNIKKKDFSGIFIRKSINEKKLRRGEHWDGSAPKITFHTSLIPELQP